MLAVIFNKFITSVGYLTARENEVELLTTKFDNLHIVSVKQFHHKSVCHKTEEVQLRFVQICTMYDAADCVASDWPLSH